MEPEHKNLIENLEITDIAEDGKSLGRHQNKVVFVKGAVPGDVVDAEIKTNRKKFIEARISEIKRPSPQRTEPFCSHFGTCGGCRWQHFSYEGQLQFKQKQVYDALTRIAGIENPQVEKIIGSQQIQHYRNRLDYTFATKEWMTKEQLHNESYLAEKALGFHVPNMFDKILDIKQCYLQPELSNEIRLFVKKFTAENNYDYYDLRSHEGFMRNLIIRNTSSGEWMVIIAFKTDDVEKRTKLLDAVKEKFPQITSLNYIINAKKNDTFNDLDVICYHGLPYITEQMENLKFRIGAKTFYQTNSEQAYNLYKVAREFASLTGNEIVYDLYTGTGTIAQFVASHCKKVTGIEYVAEATELAKENAAQNNISNATFFAGDMKDILTENFFGINGKPDVIITDPPRAGMHADVVNRILNSDAQRIVYVSCNPATQARDLKILLEKYTFLKAQPVDMFPHTTHVENVVLLQKK